jgi:hypothetical protein
MMNLPEREVLLVRVEKEMFFVVLAPIPLQKVEVLRRFPRVLPSSDR